MRALLYIFVALSFASCKSLEDPIEMVSFDGTQMEQFSGQLVKFKANFHVENKLWLPVKMKPGSFEVFVGQQKVGDLFLDEPLKLRAHRINQLTVPLHLNPEPGFIVTAYKAAKQPTTTLKISGYPKVGMLFLYKTFPISKETQIEPAKFVPYIPTF